MELGKEPRDFNVKSVPFHKTMIVGVRQKP